MAKCVLQLSVFRVNQLLFKDNPSFSGDNSLPIDPEIKVEMLKAENDEKHYKIILGCSIFNNNDAPFSVSSEVEGEFVLESEENSENLESMIQINAVAILLPYVRSLITQLTCLAERPPLFLPVLNVYSLFNSSKNGETEQAKVN